MNIRSTTFRTTAVFFFICFMALYSVDFGWAAPRVLILNESGKEIRGRLNSIRKESVTLSTGSFNLKFSLEAIELIQFTDLRETEPPRNRSVLVFEDGTVTPFHRILRTNKTGITVIDQARMKKEVSFGSLKSIHFGEAIEWYKIQYRNERGDSLTINYQPKTSEFLLRDSRWKVNKRDNLYTCSSVSNDSTSSETLPITLWKLPPEPGDRWSLYHEKGTGQWLNSSSDTRTPERFSTRTFPFRFRFPDKVKGPTVRGEFSARLLLPVQFTIEHEQVQSWTLSKWPEAMTFEPCFLYPFLADHLHLLQDTGDTEAERKNNQPGRN